MFLRITFILLGLFAIITNSKIIIIGAGPSGIAAATRLVESGYTDITVLEAENRVGGRVHSIKFASNVQDLRAQWCDGEIDNVVYEIAYPLGLLEPSKYRNLKSKFVNANGDFLPENVNEIYSHFKEFPELYNNNAPVKSTIGEYFTKNFNSYVNETNVLDLDDKKHLLEFFHLKTKARDACDSWMELPTKAIMEYDDLEGAVGNSWKGQGYQTMLDVLMKKIPDRRKELPYLEKVHLNKTVVNINWDTSNNQVKIECKDGSKYTADKVILTSSLGVLKAHYQTLFTPSLSTAKVNAIKSIGFGALDKIIFEFPYQWWPNDTTGFFFVWSKLDKAPAVQQLLNENPWLWDIPGLHAYDYQPNNLLGWIVSGSARSMERLDENLCKEKIMKLIRLVLGKKFVIPDSKSFIRTQWDSNPHFRGSYSYNTVLMEKLNATNADLAEPLRNSNNVEVLQFAGEATHSSRYATVHGAIETGWREADRILKKNH